MNRQKFGPFIVAFLRMISEFPRPVRGMIALGIDLVACVACVWLAFSIRLGVWELASPAIGIVVAVALLAWLVAASWLGVYRSIIRTSGIHALLDLATAAMLYSLPLIVIFMFVGVAGVPRTVGVLQPLLFLLLLGVNRIVIRYILVDVLQKVAGGQQDRRVAIYGAGMAGQKLGAALRREGHLKLAAYIDDNEDLAGHRIDGIKIVKASDIATVVENCDIDEILLALPGISRVRRLEIVERLAPLAVTVRSLPSLSRILDGRVSISDLREIELEELLGRDPVPPDEGLLGTAITSKDVLVSGAGGSIGSELARQIALRCPRRLILAEQSEFALYSILAEIEALVDGAVEIVPELVDVANQPAVARMMERHRPHSVFHAAAYKHVPLVEKNPISGLRNNVFGTTNCCLEAERVGVERFILVSTDKAVRPTNIMGASKRLCELILQARAALGSRTIFSMVRFGNVLGSSGSVVPRFKAQIQAGGPITLTHRDITRFFMTIPEAAQLVMQAGAMARGGEVFVLDMGEPIRIYDLACMMIQLSGCTLRDETNPAGDISIEEVGLRPGEKMFEELLLGDSPQPTQHNRILRAREVLLPWSELSQLLLDLSLAVDAGDLEAAMAVVRQCVPDYRQPDHQRPVDFSAQARIVNA